MSPIDRAAAYTCHPQEPHSHPQDSFLSLFPDSPVCCSLQNRFSQGTVQRRGNKRGGMSGKCEMFPGELRSHCRCYLRHVHNSKCRAGLQRLMS